jgi:hypothetical protein
MQVTNFVQRAPVSKLASFDLRMLLSCLAGAALLLLAIYALFVTPETDASAIVSSLVSP